MRPYTTPASLPGSRQKMQSYLQLCLDGLGKALGLVHAPSSGGVLLGGRHGLHRAALQRAVQPLQLLLQAHLESKCEILRRCETMANDW